MLEGFGQINWLISLLAAVAMSVAASLLSSLFTRLVTHWSTRLASVRDFWRETSHSRQRRIGLAPPLRSNKYLKSAHFMRVRKQYSPST